MNELNEYNVAYINETNMICYGWWQHVCQFEYDIEQEDEFHKISFLKYHRIVSRLRVGQVGVHNSTGTRDFFFSIASRPAVKAT